MQFSETLHTSLRYWARRWPERAAVVTSTATLTWRQLDGRSDTIAAGLHTRGVGPRDVVGILMHNRVEFVEVMFAAFKIGAAVAPLNLRLTPREMAVMVGDARPRVVVVDRDLLPLLADVPGPAGGPEVVVVEGHGELLALDDLRAEGPVPDPPVTGEDVALICYTSGTTGVPKGALLTHRSLYATATAKAFVLEQSCSDRLLVPMPLAYTGGCVAVIRDGVVPGATTYLTADADAGTFLDLIERERITSMLGVTVLWERMMEHPRFPEVDLTSLRIASTGGSVVSEHLLRRWYERGVTVTQGYGLTEASGSYVTYLVAEEAADHIGSVGRPMVHTEIRLVGGDGVDVAQGQAGEILVRSPTVMAGYLNRPAETAEALRDGWLHTGDMGVEDADGHYRIVDRVKDMLISGGLNVYPAEIEVALAHVPGLEELAVIGVGDARWGEVPAIVVPDGAAVDLDALHHACESRLADYKRPKYILDHQGPLPRTLSGKVQKNELRDRYRELPGDAILVREAARSR